MFYDDTNSIFWSNPHREQVSPNIGDVQHIFQVARAPLPLYHHLNINMTRPTSQYCSFICQQYIHLSWKPLVYYNALLIRSHVVQSNRTAYPFIWKSHAIHTYCRKCWTSGIVQWRCTHAMSLLIYSCQLSVSDNSFSDGQPCHNEHRCSFLCSLWLNSSNHHVYLTLFWSLPIETSWLTYVPQMHLILPLSSTSATVFRSYTVSRAGCLSFACHQATPRRCKTPVTQIPPLLGSAHAAIKSVCRATLVDAALYSCFWITSQP